MEMNHSFMWHGPNLLRRGWASVPAAIESEF
jgi:hypothetical protein